MRKRALYLVLFLLFLAGSIAAYKFYSDYKIEQAKLKWLALKEQIENEITDFSAEAGVVIKDLNMGWELNFRKKELFASASLVKVAVLAAIFQAAQEKKLQLQDTVALRANHKVNGSGVLKTLPDGSVLSIEDLAEYMICDSDNTAANILIEILGFDYLNYCFKEIGLEDTNIVRRMMDFRHRRRGVENYTTAEDMALVFEKMYRKKLINRNVSERCLNLLKRQNINDRIPAKLPAGTVVAHKTGLERRVCHDAGIVFTKNGDFLICVLTKNASSRKRAKEFIATLSLHVYNYFQHP